jgi:hypothetical protein
LITLGVLLLVVGAVAIWRVKPESRFEPAKLVMPPDAMPCNELLAKGSVLFCGFKVTGWAELSKRTPGERERMRNKTLEAAQAAGYTTVNYGLSVSQ